jgi:hypothetical protein
MYHLDRWLADGAANITIKVLPETNFAVLGVIRVVAETRNNTADAALEEPYKVL